MKSKTNFIGLCLASIMVLITATGCGSQATPTLTLSPTATSTPLLPTATPISPTNTRVIPPTATPTDTPLPPTPTNTPLPPTPTATNTLPPPTATLVPPTATLVPPTPTSTDTPMPQPDAVIRHRSLNLREGPSDYDRVIQNYPQGTELKVLAWSEDKAWLKVELPDGQVGWMWAEYIQLNLAAESVPTVTPEPYVGPRGKIAYTVYNGPQDYDIYIINADGSGKRLLVADASEPAFAPDGKQVLFYTWEGGGVDIMNLDGSGRRRVINDSEAAFANFAPDGKRIVYHTGQVNWAAWRFDLVVKTCDLNGQAVRDITPGQQPAWNPRADRIVCKTCDGSICGLFIMNSDGSARHMITTYPDDQNPAWSPDGKRIAFTSIRDGNWEIYVMNADGSAQTRLTHSPTTDSLPVWLPDGQHIAFRSDRTGAWAIYIMRDDGSEVVKLTDAPVSRDRWVWEVMAATR